MTHIFIMVEDRQVVGPFRVGASVVYFTRSHNWMLSVAQLCMAHPPRQPWVVHMPPSPEPQIYGRRSTPDTARY